MFTWLTDTQLSGMWAALSQWWTWLLHIAIQLMPYAIAFTIILLIFHIVKNWSRLKDWFKGFQFWIDPAVNLLWEDRAKKHPKAYNRAYRRADKRNARRMARKYWWDPKDYYYWKWWAR